MFVRWEHRGTVEFGIADHVLTDSSQINHSDLPTVLARPTLQRQYPIAAEQ